MKTNKRKVKENVNKKEKKLTYGNLFSYVAKKVNFRTDKKTGKTKWTCYGDLRFVKQFLKSKKIDKKTSENVINKLENTGGYCDCEVLFNSAEKIKDYIILR